MIKSFWAILSRLAMVALVLVIAMSCTKNDNTVAEPKTITDRILEDQQFSLLRAAMTYSGAGDALKAANLTLFAPNDAAFQASGITSEAAIRALPKDQVRTMVLYHTLYAPVSSTAIPAGQNAVQTASRGIAYINNTGGTIYINSAKVTQPDIKVANGILHIIDHVLTPSVGSVQATIDANSNLTFLSAAIKRIGSSNPSLVAALSNSSSANPVTIFAPSDDAFIAAGYKTLSAIDLTPTQVLSSLLSYHITSGVLLSYQFQNTSLATLLGSNRLNVNVSNGIATVKGTGNAIAASIKTADLVANNGVVHIIDQVLRP